ncbi:MAG: hypothetical protein GXY52_04550 [Chloroflexi bacterium]|nr:hypothetical protein [Chloroflexota bacterium]
MKRLTRRQFDLRVAKPADFSLKELLVWPRVDFDGELALTDSEVLDENFGFISQPRVY